jgi:iron(III) transport system permease protein
MTSVTDAVPPLGRRSRLPDGLFEWSVFGLVAVAVMIPVLFLIVGSFSLARLPTQFSLSEMGFDNYVEVWVRQNTASVLWNTVWYVAGSTTLGVGCAVILAWLVERTDIPGRLWIFAAIPLSLAVPGILQAIAWVLLLSPRAGFLNQFWMQLTGTRTPLLDIYSLWGMIVVEGLRLVPTAFLMMIPILRSMDPALEEAAAMSGANPVRTARRITLLLIMPGLVAIIMFQMMTALDAFEVPGVLGLPVNLHVMSTRVYAIIDNVGTVPAFGQANALAIVYLLLAVALSLLYFRVTRNQERFAVVTGKAYRPRRVALGGWKWPALGLVLLFVLASIVLPFLVLLYASLVKFLVPPSAAAFQNMGFEHYARIFADTRFNNAAWNTLWMVLGTATSVTVVAFTVSFVIVRTKFAARKVLDVIAFLPHAIPSIVLALAFLWFFLQVDRFTGIGSFGSIASIVIGFTVVFLAYATRSLNAAMMQIHKDLEEAARMSGASPLRVALRIFLPLLLPAIAGLWIYVTVLAIRTTSLPLMLNRGSENEVLASLIWYLWENGRIESVGAIGVLLMGLMFVLAVTLRLLGFGKD